MGIAEMLSNDGTVLALYQSIVVGSSGSGFRELLNMEFAEHGSHFMIDIFRAVVSVKSPDDKWKSVDISLEHRQQKALANALNRTDELELSDFINKVDVIQAFDAIKVALVDRIHTQVAGLAIRGGFASLTNGDFDRPGLVMSASTALIGLRMPQVVEVTVRDSCEALITLITEEFVGALT